MITPLTNLNLSKTYFNPQISSNRQSDRNFSSAAVHTERNLPPLYSGNILYFTPSFGQRNIHEKKYDLKDKTIVITGGTGTIGNYLIDSLLKNYSPKKIIVFSRDEMKQHVMKNKNNKNEKLSFVIGDVRDETALERAFKKADVVIHTAAMKHVPICEENPEEAVKTNIDGARNVIKAALNSNVKRVIAVSSDKASSPSNLYGATKFVSEKLFTNANKYTDDDGVKFSCVRLGNVVGSRGSIIPLFREQSKTGTIKITDKNMTRFFMTPAQASDLILSGIEIMNGAEIFIPKLKNTSIMELAKQVAPDAKIEYIGIRPGEKLDEDFISPVEEKSALDIKDRYVILPKDSFDTMKKLWKEGKELDSNYNYSSSNSYFKMSEKDLKKLIKEA